MTISAIVLAAGKSRRFGRDKRLEFIGSQPMLIAVASKLRDLVTDTLVVLGPEDNLHQALLAQYGIAATRCPAAARGMGHSLGFGVAQRPDSAGWLVMPADMPYISSDTIRKVLDAGAEHDLAAPTYEGQRGHPVWFSQSFKVRLCALSGDEGGRSILGPPIKGGMEDRAQQRSWRDDLWSVPV